MAITLSSKQERMLKGDLKAASCFTRVVEVSQPEADKKTDTAPVTLPEKRQVLDKN